MHHEIYILYITLGHWLQKLMVIDYTVNLPFFLEESSYLCKKKLSHNSSFLFLIISQRNFYPISKETFWLIYHPELQIWLKGATLRWDKTFLKG